MYTTNQKQQRIASFSIFFIKLSINSSFYVPFDNKNVLILLTKKIVAHFTSHLDYMLINKLRRTFHFFGTANVFF